MHWLSERWPCCHSGTCILKVFRLARIQSKHKEFPCGISAATYFPCCDSVNNMDYNNCAVNPEYNKGQFDCDLCTVVSHLITGGNELQLCKSAWIGPWHGRPVHNVWPAVLLLKFCLFQIFWHRVSLRLLHYWVIPSYARQSIGYTQTKCFRLRFWKQCGVHTCLSHVLDKLWACYNSIACILPNLVIAENCSHVYSAEIRGCSREIIMSFHPYCIHSTGCYLKFKRTILILRGISVVSCMNKQCGMLICRRRRLPSNDTDIWDYTSTVQCSGTLKKISECNQLIEFWILWTEWDKFCSRVLTRHEGIFFTFHSNQRLVRLRQNGLGAFIKNLILKSRSDQCGRQWRIYIRQVVRIAPITGKHAISKIIGRSFILSRTYREIYLKDLLCKWSLTVMR